MKKNSGEQNERAVEFPNGRENEKKERKELGPNDGQHIGDTSLQRL